MLVQERLSTDIVDCSGKCVSINFDAIPKLGDGYCDDGSRGIDLSCAFILEDLIPDFLHTPAGEAGEALSRILDFLNRNGDILARGRGDGGDCTLEDSCRAQFGTAPDYQFCGEDVSSVTAINDAFATNALGVCTFNATTRNVTTGDDGTCAEMCQQFGSQCVAALDNKTPGCTPSPKSRHLEPQEETPVKRRGRLQSVSVSGVDAPHPRGGERH